MGPYSRKAQRRKQLNFKKTKRKKTNYKDLKTQPNNETVYSQTVDLLTVRGKMDGLWSRIPGLKQNPVCNTGILYLMKLTTPEQNNRRLLTTWTGL